jgi:phosphatidylglycerophosphate synthase
MLDAKATALLRPTLLALARPLVAAGIGANAITLTGLLLGILAAAAIALHHPTTGLVLLLASRVLDGLDGSVARLTTPTDHGAFLDICCDMLFYASIPLAFAVAAPATNALPAAVLLACFVGTGSCFLAFAVLAERRGLKSTAFARKGFFYLGGLTEATETITCFALMCLWPAHFALWAYGFAVLCMLTIMTRLFLGYQMLKA